MRSLAAVSVGMACAACFAPVPQEGDCVPAVSTIPYTTDAGQWFEIDPTDWEPQYHVPISARFDRLGRLAVDGVDVLLLPDGGFLLPEMAPYTFGWAWNDVRGELRRVFYRYLYPGDGGTFTGMDTGFLLLTPSAEHPTEQLVHHVEQPPNSLILPRGPRVDEEGRVLWFGEGPLAGSVDAGVSWLEWLPDGRRKEIGYGGGCQDLWSDESGAAWALVNGVVGDIFDPARYRQYELISVASGFGEVSFSEPVVATTCRRVVGSAAPRIACARSQPTAKLQVLDEKLHVIEELGDVPAGTDVVLARDVGGEVELLISIPDAELPDAGALALLRGRGVRAYRSGLELAVAATRDLDGHLVIISPRRADNALGVERWCVP